MSQRSTAIGEMQVSETEVASHSRQESVPSTGAIVIDEGRREPLQLPQRATSSGSNRSEPYHNRNLAGWNRTPCSYFLECENTMGDKPAQWRFNRRAKKYHLMQAAGTNQAFSKQDAIGIYNQHDQCIYVTKAKTSAGQVIYSKLPEEEKKLFREARSKEMQSLLDNKAVKVLSVQESREFRKMHPEHVIESRFVDRYKPREDDVGYLEELKKRALRRGELVPPQVERGAPKSRRPSNP